MKLIETFCVNHTGLDSTEFDQVLLIYDLKVRIRELAKQSLGCSNDC